MSATNNGGYAEEPAVRLKCGNWILIGVNLSTNRCCHAVTCGGKPRKEEAVSYESDITDREAILAAARSTHPSTGRQSDLGRREHD
jgi:hypothetical protein